MRSGNRRLNPICAVFVAAVCVSGVGRTARAANHIWHLSELYSNSSGSVQFVEMHDNFANEGFLAGQTLTATDAGNTQSHVFTFPTNLPDPFQTANHYLLIATAGFGSLPGGVTADYTLPPSFLFTDGGTLRFSGSGDSISYASLPTDGTSALAINFTIDPHTSGTAVNSPTNFAGAVGSVPEPTAWAPAVAAALAWVTGGRSERRARGPRLVPRPTIAVREKVIVDRHSPSDGCHARRTSASLVETRIRGPMLRLCRRGGFSRRVFPPLSS
jgi:hypothetical protein